MCECVTQVVDVTLHTGCRRIYTQHTRAYTHNMRAHTGGLGDVMSALPKGLKRRGHRTMVVVPKYGDYKEARDTGARAQFNNFNSSQEVRNGGVEWVWVWACQIMGTTKKQGTLARVRTSTAARR